MMLSLLETLVSAVTDGPAGAEIESARELYFRLAGEPFQDEPAYEARLQNFVEWYLFDYVLEEGLTPYEAWMADAARKPAEREKFLPFRDQVHSLFLVRGADGSGLQLRDLWSGREYAASVEVSLGYDKGAVVEERLVPAAGQGGVRWCLTNTHVYHAPDVATNIRKAAELLAKDMRATLWEPFILRASLLSLKTGRYRHVDRQKIYRELIEQPAGKGKLKTSGQPA